MATRAAKVGRDAEVQKRLDAAVVALAERHGVTPPGRPPWVRDAEFRAIDERDWLATTLELIVAANPQTGGTDAGAAIPLRERPNRRNQDGDGDGV